MTGKGSTPEVYLGCEGAADQVQHDPQLQCSLACLVQGGSCQGSCLVASLGGLAMQAAGHEGLQAGQERLVGVLHLGQGNSFWHAPVHTRDGDAQAAAE